MKKSFLLIMVLFLSSGCANLFVHRIDSDGDGIIEKILYIKDKKVVKEEFDRNLDGQIDGVIHYREDMTVSMVENDTNNDSMMDARDEFDLDLKSISFRDYNYDGIMDRRWITHYTDYGQELYIEYDIDNNGIIDSRFKKGTGVRENFVKGAWIKDHLIEDKHGLYDNGVWKELIFDKGNWEVIV